MSLFPHVCLLAAETNLHFSTCTSQGHFNQGTETKTSASVWAELQLPCHMSPCVMGWYQSRVYPNLLSSDDLDNVQCPKGEIVLAISIVLLTGPHNINKIKTH